MPVIPTLREVEADACGPLWLHCEFKVSLGYNEISKNGGEGSGIEIIIATYTKASHGVIQCLIFCCHLLPWVETRVLYQLLPGNGLHSEQRNQAPYVGGTERKSLRFSSSGRREEAAAASASKWLRTRLLFWGTQVQTRKPGQGLEKHPISV